MRHKKRRRKSPFGGIIKLLILLAILGGAVFGAIKFGPLILASQLDSAQRFNVVLATDTGAAFVSVDSKAGKATVVDFPPDLYITNVAYGYGQYPIGKVFGVGELDKRGGRVLADTVALYLGVPVDGYAVVPDFDPDNLKTSLASPNFVLNADSDINVWDRVLIAKALFDLRFDRISKVDLSGKSEQLLLADGSNAKIFLTEDLDSLIEGLFTEDEIVKEGLRVQVVNTTNFAGLGNSLARLLTSLGAVVIDVTTEEEVQAACEIRATKKAVSSRTVQRIAEIFDCTVNASEKVGRADVIVYLGEAQGKFFGKK